MNLVDSLLFKSAPRICPGFGKIEAPPNAGVTVAGVPANRFVHVYYKRTMTRVGVTRSAADGSYSFTGLDPNQKFVVVAFDDQNQFNAVIRDNITPAPMP